MFVKKVALNDFLRIIAFVPTRLMNRPITLNRQQQQEQQRLFQWKIRT